MTIFAFNPFSAGGFELLPFKKGADVAGANGVLDISIPSALYPAGKKATASDTNLSAGNIKDGVDIFGVTGSFVSGGITLKGVQYGTVTIPVNQTSGTANITSVDPSKTLLIWLGSNGANVGGNVQARITLTDATTVTASRNTAINATITVSFLVLEFSLGVKSSQSGTVTIAAEHASGTAAINAVVMAKSVLVLLGLNMTNAATFTPNYWPRLMLTNTTTITATTGANIATGATQTTGFMILEFE